MDKAERTGSKLGVILLDWEKSFDKISRTGLDKALERYQVDPKLRRIITNLYTNTDFMVQLNKSKSNWQEQSAGIRQGRPLSPHLFLVVMSVLWADINEELGNNTR